MLSIVFEKQMTGSVREAVAQTVAQRLPAEICRRLFFCPVAVDATVVMVAGAENEETLAHNVETVYKGAAKVVSAGMGCRCVAGVSRVFTSPEQIASAWHEASEALRSRGAASEEMRQDIQNTLGIKAYDIYGLTELSGPGVSFECSAQSGMHINEDHFIAEIIDPDTGEVLPEGSEGELVFTSITKKAFPLLRYRTRDICTLTREKCPCGRTHVKMSKPRGRTDDMLIIRGVNVFPSQIETVLLNYGYPANYQIIVDRVHSTDTLDVQVEMTPEMFTDKVGEVDRRQKELVDGLRSMLGLSAKVTLVAPKSIVRSEGKAVRVIDKRKI